MKAWISLVAFALLPFPLTIGAGDVCLAPVPHAPIFILGDEGFTLPGSGVVAGNGSAEDPYVICGWDIVPIGRDGIRLQDTTAHVVIRDNVVRDGLVEAKVYAQQPNGPGDFLLTGGINLHNASNAVVAANHVYNQRALVSASVAPLVDGFIIYGVNGIVVEYSDAVRLTSNLVERNSASGILVRESQGVRIDNNTAIANNRFGPFAAILVYGVTGLDIEHNVANETRGVTAVSVGFSPGAVVRQNRFDNPTTFGVGIGLGSHGSSVYANEISGARIGVSTSTAANVTITSNNLAGNLEFGVRSTTHLVNGENNWWGCAEGPGQPGCVGSDGLVDYDPWATAPFDL